MKSGLNSELFSISDFTVRSVYGRIQRAIGWRRRQRGCLVLAILAPLAVFSLVTLAEHRFYPGSVVSRGLLNGRECQVVGMSFVGDPMAWGFMILVPTLIVVLQIATARTIILVNTVAKKASDAWRNDPSATGLPAVMDQTRAIWKMEARKPGWLWPLLIAGPWIAAITFWIYNTTTCAFHPSLPHSFYPYQSERVKVIGASNPAPKATDAALNTAEVAIAGRLRLIEEGRDARVSQTAGKVQTVALETPLPLKKWDCQPEVAPFSCWLTRIWTLLYYGAIPFLLRHLFLLIWGATYFLNAGTGWEERQNDRQIQAVEINPFHPDGFGGLGALSDAVIGYLYSISFVAVLLGFSFLKEGTLPAWHDYAMMLLVMPFAVAGVLAPSVAVRHTILNAKNRYLAQLADELHAIGNSILSAQPGTLLTKLREGELDKQQKAVRGFYDDVKHMSEWPFSATTLMRMIFPVAAPWLPAVLKEMAGPFFK